MNYKPYSQEWHRYRYLKEAIDKYLDDYVENDIIMGDILSIVCDRQEKAHAEYHRLEDLELKLDFRDWHAIYSIQTTTRIYL